MRGRVRGGRTVRPEANRNKLIIALKRAIADTFDDGKWRELGYLSDTIQIIENHDRLLRSLYWGDNDYEGCILQVLPTIIGLNNEKLSLVENFVGLEAWLKENDLPLYAELYGGGDLIPLSHVEEASHTLDVIELNRYAARIRHGIDNDPAQAIGSAKELL